jgi:hypothetical protein
VFQTKIDMVATQCAVHLCEGSAEQVVIDFSGRNRRLPLNKELFALLHQQAGIIDSDSERESD